MKNRVTKLVLLVLSLALLVGGAIGISVSADSTAPEIISKNVMDTGDFCLMFAVDPATVTGEDVTLRVYDRDPSDAEAKLAFEETKAVTATEKIDLDGDRTPETAVIVFTTAGVAAKDFADVWYIETESADSKKVITYSVMEYAFERLYRDGTVLATDKDDDLYRYYQKEFYFGMLNMGSAAQNLHVNYGNAEPERLIKEYTYVSVLDGTYTAGDLTADRGFVEANTAITLNANDAEAIKGWSILTYGQNGVEIDRKVANDGDTITVTGNTVVIPYEIGVTAGKYFDEIGDKKYNFSDMASSNFAGNGGDYYLAHYNFSSAYGSYAFADSGDVDYGKVLKLTKPIDKQSSGGYVAFPIQNVAANGNCLVFEFDFRYSATTNYSESIVNGEYITDGMYLAWCTNEYNSSTAPTVAYGSLSKKWNTTWSSVDLDGTLDENKDGGDVVRVPKSTNDANDKPDDMAKNTWYNVCFEVYTDSNAVVLYINGEAVATYTYSTAFTVSDVNTVAINFTHRFKGVEIQFDNVFAGTVNKEYKAQ